MSRLLYNRAIINKLSELIEKYPYFRFGQLLINCEILKLGYKFFPDSEETFIEDCFNEESETMRKRMINNKLCFDV